MHACQHVMADHVVLIDCYVKLVYNGSALLATLLAMVFAALLGQAAVCNAHRKGMRAQELTSSQKHFTGSVFLCVLPSECIH